MATPIVVDDSVIGAVAISAPVTHIENDELRKKMIELVEASSNEIEFMTCE